MESNKILLAQVVHENAFIKTGLFFSLARKVLRWLKFIPSEGVNSSKANYRLISPNSFFTEGFLDVFFDQRPKINQEFRIKGIDGKWLLMRRSSIQEVYEEVVRKERKLNKGKIRSIDRLLEEEYPYLFVNEGLDQEELEILEVLELD